MEELAAILKHYGAAFYYSPAQGYTVSLLKYGELADDIIVCHGNLYEFMKLVHKEYNRVIKP